MCNEQRRLKRTIYLPHPGATPPAPTPTLTEAERNPATAVVDVAPPITGIDTNANKDDKREIPVRVLVPVDDPGRGTDDATSINKAEIQGPEAAEGTDDIASIREEEEHMFPEDFDGAAECSLDEYMAASDVAEAAQPPRPGLQRGRRTTVNNGVPLPVRISKSITTTNVKDLNELLQRSSFKRLRLETEYHFREQGLGFGVTLQIQDALTKELIEGFRLEETFPGKKQAKEMAAGHGLEYVKNLPDEVKNRNVGYPDEESESEDDRYDWVSGLQNYCAVCDITPEYSFFRISGPPEQFSCEVRLPEALGVPGAGVPGVGQKIFGNQLYPHPNKKRAKTRAAKEALTWLKSQPGFPPKKLKATKSGVLPPGTVLQISKSEKHSKVVQDTCPRVGFSVPKYVYESDPSAVGIWDISVILKRGEGKPIRYGPIKNVHGKKKAKEEMDKRLVTLLEKEAQKKEITLQFVD